MVRACLLALLLVACGDKPEEAPPPGPGPETLPGVWAGVFPCANCPGIDATLWLRADGRFFFEQRYRENGDEGEGDGVDASVGLGRWEWRPEERLLALTGEGPVRLFERPESYRLLMRSSVPEPHRLDRREGTPNFEGVIRVRGTVRAAGDAHLFHECLSGYEVPLQKAGDYPRFARQFRNVVPRGESAPVEFEGYFDWGLGDVAAGFHIRRFVTIRQSGGC